MKRIFHVQLRPRTVEELCLSELSERHANTQVSPHLLPSSAHDWSTSPNPSASLLPSPCHQAYCVRNCIATSRVPGQCWHVRRWWLHVQHEPERLRESEVCLLFRYGEIGRLLWPLRSFGMDDVGMSGREGVEAVEVLCSGDTAED